MIIHREFQQGSDEWFDCRLGKITGTDFTTLCNPKSKATYQNLIYKKAAEILTGKRQDGGYYNSQMERGNLLESEAREYFSEVTGLPVEEVGLIEVSEFVGVSPDGLILLDEGLEIKCKDNHTHLKCLLKGDNSYKWQIYANIWAYDAQRWHFISYNPNFPDGKKMFHEVWERDESIIELINDRVKQATIDIKAVLEELK